MTEREDMRYWPFGEHEQGGRSLHRVRNGTTDAGIRWAVMGSSGSIAGCNGYAQIPWEGHPWSGCTDYDKLDVNVHGGLTYGPKPFFDFGAKALELYEMTKDTNHSTPKPPEGLRPIPEVTFVDCGGWIGFDTQHAWDYWPDEELARIGLERRGGYSFGNGDVVWHLERVVAEAVNLANQIAVHGHLAKANRKEERHDRRRR